MKKITAAPIRRIAAAYRSVISGHRKFIRDALDAGYSKRSVRWRSVCHQSRWLRYQSTVVVMPARAA